MASVKRLLKERAGVAKNPIPYVTFMEDDDDDDAMTDASADINEWRFVLVLDPAHDALGEASDIGKAADSPYCKPPPPSSSATSPTKGGILSGVKRAASKSSKKSGDNSAGQSTSESESGLAYFAFQLDFPTNYPFKPPTITVLGTNYHPNIKQDTGAMCDEILTGDGWGREYRNYAIYNALVQYYIVIFSTLFLSSLISFPYK